MTCPAHEQNPSSSCHQAPHDPCKYHRYALTSSPPNKNPHTHLTSCCHQDDHHMFLPRAPLNSTNQKTVFIPANVRLGLPHTLLNNQLVPKKATTALQYTKHHEPPSPPLPQTKSNRFFPGPHLILITRKLFSFQQT
jgi:hypothetical protein